MKAHTRSKTIWFNVALGVVGVLEVKLGLLAGLLGPTIYPVAAVVVPVIGVYLRTVTTEPVGKNKAIAR